MCNVFREHVRAIYSWSCRKNRIEACSIHTTPPRLLPCASMPSCSHRLHSCAHRLPCSLNASHVLSCSHVLTTCMHALTTCRVPSPPASYPHALMPSPPAFYPHALTACPHAVNACRLPSCSRSCHGAASAVRCADHRRRHFALPGKRLCR